MNTIDIVTAFDPPFEDIVRIHAARYPLMRANDLVKLTFQNEFGCGHLVKDAKAAETRLYEELGAVSRAVGGVKTPGVCGVAAPPEYEAIGNGYVRVHLAALMRGDGKDDGDDCITDDGTDAESYGGVKKEQNHAGKLTPKRLFSAKELTPKRLLRAFILSANAGGGSVSGFLSKLGTVRGMLPELKLDVTAAEFDAFVRECEAAGFPPVSHSEVYREAYRPAYRVVRAEYLQR